MELTFTEQKIKQLEAENKSLLQKNHEISEDCFRLIKLYRDAFIDVTANIFDVMSSLNERVDELDRKVNIICGALGEPQAEAPRAPAHAVPADEKAVKIKRAAKSVRPAVHAVPAAPAVQPVNKNEHSIKSGPADKPEAKRVFKSSVISDIESLQATIDKMRLSLSFTE